MPFDPRFLHWLQGAEEELLYKAGELRNEAVQDEPLETYNDWVARAHRITAENTALQAQEEYVWPN